MASSPKIFLESRGPPTTAFTPPPTFVRCFSPPSLSSTCRHALNQLGQRVRLGIDGRLEIATMSKREREREREAFLVREMVAEIESEALGSREKDEGEGN